MPDVLLHGFFAGPALWRAVQRRLQGLDPERPSVALPLPFHGGGRGSTFAQCCELMWRHVELSTTNTHGPVHLIGYSLGARMALTMACMAPQRVAALTLIGVHPGLEDAEARAKRRRTDGRWQALLRQNGLAETARLWDTQDIFAHRQALSPEMQQTLEAARAGLDAADLAHALGVLGLGEMPPQQPHLLRLTMPVTLMAGARDTKFVRIAQMLAPQLPKTQVHLISDAHHDVVLTHPNAVAQRLHAVSAGLS